MIELQRDQHRYLDAVCREYPGSLDYFEDLAGAEPADAVPFFVNPAAGTTATTGTAASSPAGRVATFSATTGAPMGICPGPVLRRGFGHRILRDLRLR